MNAPVVYVSGFVNTEKVACAIKGGLNEVRQVMVSHVKQVSSVALEAIDPLVVVSPSQRLRPTPSSINFLRDIPDGKLDHAQVAVWDTRVT
ncbi:MAG: hypothetical protein PVI81_09105 [Anaerolineales bacterium]|jgi:menaquinone-dependent protoporphyrinogen IX oxidase